MKKERKKEKVLSMLSMEKPWLSFIGWVPNFLKHAKYPDYSSPQKGFLDLGLSFPVYQFRIQMQNLSPRWHLQQIRYQKE